MDNKFPILVTQKIMYVSGTYDMQAVAGLMQVQQAAISNQITMHICIMGTMITLLTVIAGLLGYVGFRNVKEYATKKAVEKATEEANKHFNKLRDEFLQNYVATVVDDNMPANSPADNSLEQLVFERRS